MTLLFWTCLALVAYTYIGYPVWLWLFVHWRERPILRRPIEPSVSIIIAARNEEANIPAKLRTIQLLDYPQNRLQIVVASDGSTDRTVSILREHASVVPVILDQSKGKACALNEAVKFASGEILVFMDARQTVDRDAQIGVRYRFRRRSDWSDLRDSARALYRNSPRHNSRRSLHPDECGSHEKKGGVSTHSYRTGSDFQRKGERVLAEGSDVDWQLPVIEIGAMAAFAIESASLSLHQPQTFAPCSPRTVGTDVVSLGQRKGIVLSGSFLDTSAILRFGYSRNLESSYEEIQADRYRQHVCHAQCGCSTSVLQLCRRTKKSMALANRFRSAEARLQLPTAGR